MFHRFFEWFGGQWRKTKTWFDLRTGKKPQKLNSVENVPPILVFIIVLAILALIWAVL